MLLLEPIPAYALWAAAYPPHAHNPLMLAEERAMLGLIDQDLWDQRVLDVGCGSGRYMQHAQQRGACAVVGADASAAMLARNPCANRVEAIASHLPVRDAAVDLTLCALTLGHVENLMGALAELKRVTRAGGKIVCSDFHPAGAALGWRREFKHNGQRYAVRHFVHGLADWSAACAGLGLAITALCEPKLNPNDIPSGARFDPVALTIPVVLVIEMRA
jgi:malonyl-CoA O-methyltransferase